jgi:hypothetical protein
LSQQVRKWIAISFSRWAKHDYKADPCQALLELWYRISCGGKIYSFASHASVIYVWRQIENILSRYFIAWCSKRCCKNITLAQGYLLTLQSIWQPQIFYWDLKCTSFLQQQLYASKNLQTRRKKHKKLSQSSLNMYHGLADICSYHIEYDLHVFQGKGYLPRAEISRAADCLQWIKES